MTAIRAGVALLLAAAASAPGQFPLARRYEAGDSLHYRMHGLNVERSDTIRYEADASGVVGRDSIGRFLEDLAWTRLRRDDSPATTPSPARSHEALTLDPDKQIIPEVARLDPRLIGPALDLFTFYIDARLAASQSTLQAAGDHVFLPLGVGGSWADGVRTLVGQDAVDFDVTWVATDAARGTATVRVRHVPPASAKLRLAAPWMNALVADRPNNWVEVARASDGTYRARVGSESFDVTLTVSTRDGRLLGATMVNPVAVRERACTDRALTDCAPETRYSIYRRIEVEIP